jgi:hypothetical protein
MITPVRPMPEKGRATLRPGGPPGSPAHEPGYRTVSSASGPPLRPAVDEAHTSTLPVRVDTRRASAPVQPLGPPGGVMILWVLLVILLVLAIVYVAHRL